MPSSTATFSTTSASQSAATSAPPTPAPAATTGARLPAPVRGDRHVRSRAWCFTLNNPTPEETEAVHRFGRTCVRMIAASEKGEAEGTPHIQGYLERRDPVSLQTMKNAIPRAHFETRLGTALQAWVYCEKQDENPFIHGEKPKPPARGKRTDLERAATIVVERGLTALAEEMPQQVRNFAPYERLFASTPLTPSWYPSQEDHWRYPRYTMTEVGYLPEDMVYLN